MLVRQVQPVIYAQHAQSSHRPKLVVLFLEVKQPSLTFRVYFVKTHDGNAECFYATRKRRRTENGSGINQQRQLPDDHRLVRTR